MIFFVSQIHPVLDGSRYEEQYRSSVPFLSMRHTLRYSRFLSHSVPFFVIPSLILYPQVEIPAITIQTHQTSSTPTDAVRMQADLFTYDDVLDLIEELEEGELEKRCSIDQLDRINYFLALFAKHGLLPNEMHEESILENDIQELLDVRSDVLSPYLWNIHSTSPAIYYFDGKDIVLCKSWIHKKWDQTKKFVKKHKKALIIGAAVVVAAAVVVGVVAAISSASIAAAGAAASGEESDDTNVPPPSQPEAQTEPLDLKTALDEHISSFKEMIVEDGLLQAPENSKIQEEFGEKTRELGAFLAHETLEGISELASCVPQLFEEIREIGSEILPKSFLQHNDLIQNTPMENFEELIASGHQKIDQLFSTDQAELYSTENEGKNRFVVGIIPLPGLLSESLPTTGRIAATQASDVWGWTLGQPIQNRTLFGTVPKWSTVRRRYWKNRAEWAKSNPHNYGERNLPRMEKGLAPQRVNTQTGQLESMELHHDPAQKDGGLFDFIELWPDEHAKLDPKRYLGE